MIYNLRQGEFIILAAEETVNDESTEYVLTGMPEDGTIYVYQNGKNVLAADFESQFENLQHYFSWIRQLGTRDLIHIHNIMAISRKGMA